MFASLLKWLLNTSLLSVPLIVFYFLVRNHLFKHMHYELVLCLWIMIFTKLLVPIPFKSPLSINSISQLSNKGSLNQIDFNFIQNLNNPSNSLYKLPYGDSYSISLQGIWIIGFIIALFIWNYTYFKQTKKLSNNTIKYSCNNFISNGSNLIYRYPIYISESITSPLIIGLLKPKILIPTSMINNFTAEELTHIVLHELTHIKKIDHLINYLVSIPICLYWFNPIIYFLTYEFSNDREILCDRKLLKDSESISRLSYGKTLIKVLRYIKLNKIEESSYLMPEGFSTIEKRIMCINNTSKGNYPLANYLIFTTLLFTIFLTTPYKNIEHIFNDFSWPVENSITRTSDYNTLVSGVHIHGSGGKYISADSNGIIQSIKYLDNQKTQITIVHENGYSSFYDLKGTVLVNIGEEVATGQKIAYTSISPQDKTYFKIITSNMH